MADSAVEKCIDLPALYGITYMQDVMRHAAPNEDFSNRSPADKILRWREILYKRVVRHSYDMIWRIGAC